MLCQECKKNEAIFFYTETINGKTVSYALCDKCKKKYFQKGLENDPFESLSVFGDSFFSPFFAPEALFHSPATSISEPDMCPSCGATIYELEGGKKPFCPDCYEHFGEKLDKFLKSIHGASRHTTKENATKDKTYNTPPESDKSVELKKKLANAINEERYEDAAVLRDEIKKLEGKEAENE